MQTTEKKVKENEVKSNLLAAALFSGNPLTQVFGEKGFNKLFNTLSDNYNKMDYNTYYVMKLLLK